MNKPYLFTGSILGISCILSVSFCGCSSPCQMAPDQLSDIVNKPTLLEKRLAKGLDPNTELGYQGVTLLYTAVFQGQLKSVELLLKYGADPNRDASPLVTAIQLRRLDVISTLLEYGADVNGRTTHEKPISWAISRGDVEVVKILLAHGADLRDDRNAYDALCSVSVGFSYTQCGYVPQTKVSNYWDIVNMLDAKGIKIDATNGQGRTVLFNIDTWRNAKWRDWLIRRGCDPKQRDVNGLTAEESSADTVLPIRLIP